MSAELTAEFKNTLEKTKLINIEVNNEVKKSFIAYAMAVNVSRAIPDVRDGMKPVHRRILYSMHEAGLTSDKAFRKCAKIVGDVLGKYHPHGDSSVYYALVRLAQDFSINFPLVDGHGNFGSVDGDPAAAYRYTEARLSKLANEMLKEIDKDTVDFYPNFDDTEMQPVVLPSRFPNILVNGSDGIAVGMATNIPPHNLAECLDACIALLDNPEITVDELMEYIPAPDYPTGGVLMGRAGIKQAYRTGRGGFVLRAKTDIEEFNNGTRERIVVTELPYQVNKAMLIKSIADMVKDKRIEGIVGIILLRPKGRTDFFFRQRMRGSVPEHQHQLLLHGSKVNGFVTDIVETAVGFRIDQAAKVLRKRLPATHPPHVLSETQHPKHGSHHKGHRHTLIGHAKNRGRRQTGITSECQRLSHTCIPHQQRVATDNRPIYINRRIAVVYHIERDKRRIAQPFILQVAAKLLVGKGNRHPASCMLPQLTVCPYSVLCDKIISLLLDCQG